MLTSNARSTFFSDKPSSFNSTANDVRKDHVHMPDLESTDHIKGIQHFTLFENRTELRSFFKEPYPTVRQKKMLKF